MSLHHLRRGLLRIAGIHSPYDCLGKLIESRYFRISLLT